MITGEDIFKLMFNVYWGTMLLALLVMWLLVWNKIKIKRDRWLLGGILSCVIVSSCVAPLYEKNEEIKQERDEAMEKYLPAKNKFDEYCKNAGYKIYRTVDDVEGVTLLKVWPKRDLSKGDLDNQMWEYAGLARINTYSYTNGFLYWRIWDSKQQEYKNFGNGSSTPVDLSKYINEDAGRYSNVNSYQYVDVLDQGEYRRYQYLDLYDLSPDHSLIDKPISKPSRYTVDFENPVIAEDRKLWIATTKASIRDSETNELLAEASWYTLHGGQGKKKYSTTGIWDRAKTCPDIAVGQHNPIQNFTLSVLKPKQLPPQNVTAPSH